MRLGIDVGSTTVKLVLLNDANEIVYDNQAAQEDKDMGETKLMGKAFGDEIFRRLAETAEQGCSVSMEQVDKNNGQKREGIVIRAERSRISPVFYNLLFCLFHSLFYCNSYCN